MNKTLTLAVAGLCALGLASCNEEAKLASQVEGIWSGTTTQMNQGKKQKGGDASAITGATVNSVTPSFTFTPDESVKNGGKVIYSGVYSISQPVNSATVGVPFKVTANVKTTASGTWQAVDDDEITVTFDATSVNTTLDPQSVAFSYAELTDKPVSELDSLKANLLPNLEISFGGEIQKRVASIKKLDDVKVRDNSMTLEIGKTDYTFTKQ